MQFLVSPGNLLLVAKPVKIIGVFAFLAPVDPHQNQFPATLRRGKLRIFMKGDHSITSIEIG